MDWEVPLCFPLSSTEKDDLDLILSIFYMTIRHKDFGIYGLFFLVTSKQPAPSMLSRCTSPCFWTYRPRYSGEPS